MPYSFPLRYVQCHIALPRCHRGREPVLHRLACAHSHGVVSLSIDRFLGFRGGTLENSNAQQAPKEIICLYAMCDEPMYRQLQTHFSLWQEKGFIRWLELSAGADVE